MIKPTPYKQVCSQCNWKKIIAPLSDAITLRKDMPEQECPMCGAELCQKALTIFDQYELRKVMNRKRKRFIL